jgi:hypothetical protein
MGQRYYGCCILWTAVPPRRDVDGCGGRGKKKQGYKQTERVQKKSTKGSADGDELNPASTAAKREKTMRLRQAGLMQERVWEMTKLFSDRDKVT